MQSKLRKIHKLSDRSNGHASLEAKFNSLIVDPKAVVRPPRIVYGITNPVTNDIDRVGTKGNISMLQGPTKSRKTFVTSAIAAAIVGVNQQIGFRSGLESPGRVLFVDTEQDIDDCRAVLNRIMRMSGYDMEDFEKHMMFLTMRSEFPNDRAQLIQYGLENHGSDIDLLIIDGTRDLVNSTNDETDTMKCLTDLMTWSSKYDIHILNVLHENKSDRNARGHLGTELQNKCESVLRVSKIENNPDYSGIESIHTRGVASFSPIVFYIDDKGLPSVDTSVEIEPARDKKKRHEGKKKSPAPDDIPDDSHLAAIRLAFANERGMFDDAAPLSAREFNRRLKKAMQDSGYNISDHKARDLTSYYLDKRFLINAVEDTDTKSKKLLPGFDDDIPF